MNPGRMVRLRRTACQAILIIGIGGSAVAGDQAPTQAGQHVAVKGTFVRVAANDEGWVVVGYRVANESVGEKWMLLDVGITLTKTDATHTLTRDDLKLVTPNNTVISLPTQEEFEKVRGSLAPLVKRAATVRDRIDYFPRGANRRYALDLFVDPTALKPQVVRDPVDLSGSFGYVGRIYFEVPGGIRIGNYNLDVRFANSIVKVPMEIMTKDREKEFTKEWKAALKNERKKK